MSTELLAWTTFIVAVIGAGAWIPIVVSWLKKPKVHLVLADSAEISYMAFGAVLNIGCAFAAFDKAALVQSIKLTIEHETGRRTDFRCVGLSESTTAHSSTGERIAWDKQARTHTVTLPQDSSADRLVLFRHAEMMDSLRDRYNKLVPAVARLREANPNNWRDELRSTLEFDEYRQTVRNGQIWQSGSYRATIEVSVRQLSEPVSQTFEFHLSDADLRGLDSNLSPIDNFIIGTLLQTDPLPVNPVYVFAYPNVAV